MYSNSLLFLVLSLLTKYHFSKSDTIYIVTSPSDPCPGEFTGVPCLTLEQYTLNPGNIQNTTLIVESRTHNFSTVLSISNGHNFTMLSSNATVVCTTSSAKIEFISSQNIHISGVTFRGCRSSAIMLRAVTNARIVNSSFLNNQWKHGNGSGGGLYVTYSSVTISNCMFQSNQAYFAGGAISASYSNMTVRKSVFNDNSIFGTNRDGGAISIDDVSSKVVIEGSIFSNNRAPDSGGAIYCTGDLKVNDTIFRNNNALFGGAIYSGDTSPITITGCHFINNTASNRGGAIYKTNSDLSLVGCQLTSNSAGTDGGAISYRFGRKLVLNGCQFDHNRATGSGGAIYKTESSLLTLIEESEFFNNTAVSYGGCVYASGSIDVVGSSFSSCTALQEGGGAIYSNSRYANVSLSSSTFDNNSAPYCGVLDVDNFEHFSIDLTNSVFTHNSATGQTIGGGVACVQNATVNIINSSFKHNSANYHAGVFYIDESVTTVDGSLFINNSAALDGGVFYTYVHASEYFITGSQFSENEAGNDGGVFFIGRMNSNITILQTDFDFNSAGNRGGVVALVGSSMFMEINGSNIYNNTAQLGGVISACNSHVTVVGEGLNVTVDSVHTICKLYEGDFHHHNGTTHQDPDVTTTTEATPSITPPTVTTVSVATDLSTMKEVIMDTTVTLDNGDTNGKSDNIAIESEPPTVFNVLSVISLLVSLVATAVAVVVLVLLVQANKKLKHNKQTNHGETVQSTRLNEYAVLNSHEEYQEV